ncbi:MAG: TrgA family protein [Boseongicola sp.]|nr:MAG: TrgA family protein [Boseongicola sp.]
MPTGGKLVAAIAFAALAYFITDLIKPLLPEGSRVGWFSQVNAGIGLVMGWTILGRGAGKTYRQAYGYGLTTLGATFFWSLVVWAGYEMLRRSMRLYYDGPIEALQEMAQLILDYGKLALVQDVILPAVVGALFVSWLTEFFARRWS